MNCKVGYLTSAVSTHDTLELAPAALGLWCGSAGTLVVVNREGSTITFVGCAAGTVVPAQVAVVKDTGTTVTDIVALF